MPQLNGSGHTIVADGTDIAEAFGMVLSRFSEQLPEPKVTKVDIPAGVDLDITEALGVIGYHNGTHTLELYLVADSEAERVRLTRELVAMLHGQAMDYRLSWDDAYTYHGRFQVALDGLTPRGSRVTLAIDRQPWKKGRSRESIVLDCHPSATAELDGSARFHTLQAILAQSGSTKVGDASAVERAVAGTYTLANDAFGETDVEGTVDDWLMYVDEDGDLKVNPSKFSMSGTNAVIDADYYDEDSPIVPAEYDVSNGNMVFPDVDKQKVTVRYYRWDL